MIRKNKMTEVRVALYDLSRGMASTMSQAILGQRIDGIWHTGIVVYSIEYYFGGGVNMVPEGTFSRQNGLQPSNIISIGRTSKTRQELEQWIGTIRHRYTQETYDLIRNNCNNFSDEVARFLLDGTGIPRFIVDLPQTVFSTPLGSALRPMIEQMQNQVNAMGADIRSLDPFAGSHNYSGQPMRGNYVGMPASESPAPALQGGVNQRAVAGALATGVGAIPAYRTPASLETQYLVSGDRSIDTIRTFGAKLARLEGLVQDDIDTLAQVVDVIISGSRTLPPGALSLLLKLAGAHKKSQVAALFLLRLAVMLVPPSNLADEVTRAETTSLTFIAESLATMTTTTAASADNVAQEQTFFTGNPAIVMGLCTLSNLFCVTEARLWTFSDQGGPTAAAAALLDHSVNAASALLGHPYSPVRSMAASLCYNLALATPVPTSAHAPPSVVEQEGCDEKELPVHIVQLLCGTLEGVEDEKEVAVKRRRLRTALLLLRRWETSAVVLARDLGFSTGIELSYASPEVEAADKEVLIEIHHRLNA